MSTSKVEPQILEALRKGIPSQREVSMYSVGNEKLISGIERFHLRDIGDRGIIRFVSGSWGAGKTHLFRLIREAAFRNKCMVANVELNKSEAPLDKFERVFHAIVRKVSTPLQYETGAIAEVAPFGAVLRETVAFLGGGNGKSGDFETVAPEVLERAVGRLMENRAIDIDFKKIVSEYWRTLVPGKDALSTREQRRAELLQWFGGEGTLGHFRQNFQVNKIVNKDCAKPMLQSLAAFVRMSGYNGLVILFDEAEMSFSAMRHTELKAAHNNLLSLINNIESLAGLYLVYATVPEFFDDPKRGIKTYGALASRIGTPERRPPRANDCVWNLDAIVTGPSEYQIAARKIRDIYVRADPEASAFAPDDSALDEWVNQLYSESSPSDPVRFWRFLTSGVVRHLDDLMEGDSRTTGQMHDDLMDQFRED